MNGLLRPARQATAVLERRSGPQAPQDPAAPARLSWRHSNIPARGGRPVPRCSARLQPLPGRVHPHHALPLRGARTPGAVARGVRVPAPARHALAGQPRNSNPAKDGNRPPHCSGRRRPSHHHGDAPVRQTQQARYKKQSRSQDTSAGSYEEFLIPAPSLAETKNCCKPCCAALSDRKALRRGAFAGHVHHLQVSCFNARAEFFGVEQPARNSGFR